MHDWHREALNRFPEFAADFEKAESPYTVWIDLQLAFARAYTSGNRSLIERVYDYAQWCTLQSPGATAEDDLATCAAVGFYEHILEIPAAAEEITRWMSYDDVKAMREILSYHAGEEAYENALARFGGKAKTL